MNIKPRSMTILSDADGCLLNWNKGFCDFMEGKGHPMIPGTEDKYSISDRHGVTDDQGYQFVKEYNHSDFMKNLDAFADSVEYVGKLAKLGFKFTIVTSISDDPEAKDNRTENLKKHFGDVFNEVHCLKMGESKAHILQQNWGGSQMYWIEDHNRQAEAGHEAGLKTILIDHPYNAHSQTDLFPRVSNATPWKEIYEIICREYGLVEA